MHPCQSSCDSSEVYVCDGMQLLRLFSREMSEDEEPGKLKVLVNMILEWPSIQDQTDNDNKSVRLTIAQLIIFNSVKPKKRCGETTNGSAYDKNRDTIYHLPKPCYLCKETE